MAVNMSTTGVLALIASAMNNADVETTSYRKELANMALVQQRNALVFEMNDGSRFKVTVEVI